MIIEIPNRYEGEVTRLIPLNECIYEVDFTDNPYPYKLIFGKDNETIEAFYPQGGPSMSIGYVIDNKYKIKQIARDENTKRLLVTLDTI
jgi:hypothetical protein